MVFDLESHILADLDSDSGVAKEIPKTPSNFRYVLPKAARRAPFELTHPKSAKANTLVNGIVLFLWER